MSRNPAPGRSDSTYRVVGVAAFVFLALLGVAAWKSSTDLAAARQRERLLETRIQEKRDRIDELRGRIERLRSDPGMLERHAREDLGMVRPGDVIIELPLEPAPEPAPVPPPILPVRAP